MISYLSSGVGQFTLRRSFRFGCLLIPAVFVFLCFMPALKNGFINWDDNLFVYENPNIDPFSHQFWPWIIHPFQGNWTPLAFLSHGLDYALYGLNPAGHHFTSILLHGCNTFLVALVFFELIQAKNGGSLPSERADQKFAITAAVFGALYFGLSPLRVESVVWISERRDVLFLFFGLLSSYCYLLCYSPRNLAPYPAKKKPYLLLSLLFFTCGLLSKSMLVTLPVVFLIFDFYPLQRFSPSPAKKEIGRLLREKLPFFLLAGLVSLTTFYFQRSGGNTYSLVSLPFLARIGAAGYATLFYISKAVLPLDLSPLYAIGNIQSSLPLHQIAAWGVVVLLTGLAVLSVRYSRLYVSLWAFYLITIVPICGVFQAGQQFAADRYTYYPGLSLELLFGIVCGQLACGEPKRKRLGQLTKNTCLFAAGGYLLVNVLLLEKQIKVWSDSITFWSYQIDLAPAGASPTPYINRGGAYFAAGNLNRAIADFSAAVTIDPTNSGAIADRGIAYMKSRDYRRGVADLIVAARLGHVTAQKFLTQNKINWVADAEAKSGASQGKNTAR